jgi:excisionase family DNA binding protein
MRTDKEKMLCYNVPEIAQLMGISVQSARLLTKRRGFPVITIGRRILIPKERFNAWLNSENSSTG